VDDARLPDLPWSTDGSADEWWPTLPARVGPGTDDDAVNLTQRVPGGQSRIAAAVPLLNQREVPPGVHHDVDYPIPVTVALRWETGTELLDTVAVESDRHLIRVRVSDLRVMTGAVWVPVEDVRRRIVRSVA
jgi:hypothetical protein